MEPLTFSLQLLLLLLLPLCKTVNCKPHQSLCRGCFTSLYLHVTSKNSPSQNIMNVLTPRTIVKEFAWKKLLRCLSQYLDQTSFDCESYVPVYTNWKYWQFQKQKRLLFMEQCGFLVTQISLFTQNFSLIIYCVIYIPCIPMLSHHLILHTEHIYTYSLYAV